MKEIFGKQKYNRSLANNIASKVAVSVAFVIVVITAVAYLYITSLITNQSIQYLKQYITEKGQRDRVIFQLAELNHVYLKNKLVELLKKPITPSQLDIYFARFDKLFTKFPDGVTRNRLEGFDGTKQAFAYIGKDVNVNDNLKRQIITFLDLSNENGPSWHHQFQNIYFTTMDNILVGYWPEVPMWAHEAANTLNMTKEEFVWVADKSHNPTRKSVWTGLFYDAVGKTWMVSLETPVDIDGAHIATIGHDVTLNELFERSVKTGIKGISNIIFREDGRLILHPDKMDEIQSKGGYYNILDSADDHLKKMFNVVVASAENIGVIENSDFKEYLAFNRSDETGWYTVTVYPKLLISKTAYSTAKVILALGVVLLMVVISVLMFILKNNITRPFSELVKMTDLIRNGDYHERLDDSRQDEIGEISHSFNTMSNAIRLRSDDLQRERMSLEERVKERTNDLAQEVMQRRKIELNLQEREKKLRIVMETVADGIITIDKMGMIETFNRGATNIFGYEVNEILGQNIKLLMTDEIASKHDDYMMQFSGTDNSKLLNQGRRLLARHKLGHNLWVEIAISDTVMDGKHYIVGAIHDVSHQLAIENELRIATEHAEKANVAKSEFLSSMSHELRTPLNAIIGFSQLLTRDNDLSLEQMSDVNDIENAGKHLLELINEILDLSKVESGAIDIDLEEVKVTELIFECIDLVERQAANHGVVISFEKEQSEQLYLNTDRKRVRQIILNVLTNSIKYNVENGKVFVNCYQYSDQKLIITVKDTGIGIPSEKLENVFEPFDRLGKHNSDIEGTGIGLTITKKLIKLIGGEISVESVVNVGSTFSIVVPGMVRVRSGDTDKNKAQLIELDLAPLNDIKTANSVAKILYIEDNLANTRLMNSLVSRIDYIDIINADSGAMGVEMAISNTPNLILLDINLPDMDGYVVLDILKKNPITSEIPTIAISANAMQSDIAKAMSFGFTEYVTKPINIVNLLSIIQKTLDRDSDRSTRIASTK